MDRREFLLCAGAVGGVAGCLGDGGEAAEDHPATRDPDVGLRAGAPIDLDGDLIVAFEDPSCVACGRFHEGPFRELRAELLDPGAATFLYRPVRVVAEWADPAGAAVLATAHRDREAAWTLLQRYHDERDRLSTGTVLERTAAILDAETAVDGAAVREDVASGRYDDDLAFLDGLFEDLDARGTPTFYVFSEGEFVTDVLGVQEYEVFAGALDA